MPWKDDFNRANGALGGSWNTTGITIASNQATAATTGFAIWKDFPDTADYWAEIKFIGVGGADVAWLMVRADLIEDEWWGYRIKIKGNADFELSRVVGDAETVLVSTVLEADLSGTNLVRIEVHGSVIKAYHNGINWLTHDDGGNAAMIRTLDTGIGRPAFYLEGVQADDFYCDRVVSQKKRQKKATSKLLFQRRGDTGYIDFGNVVKQHLEPQVTRVTHMARQNGHARVDFENVGVVRHQWMLTLDEATEEALRFLCLGTKAVNDQAADDGLTFSVVDPPEGSSFLTGKVSMTNIVYDGEGAPVEGTDYRINAGTGLIEILTDYFAANGHTFSITYDVPDVARIDYSAIEDLFVDGDFVLIDYDGQSTVPRSRVEGPGQLAVQAWGEFTGDAINEFDLLLLASGEVKHYERASS